MKQAIFFTVFVMSLVSCYNKNARGISASEEMQADLQPGECPYLTRDTKGNTILSWVRVIDDSTTAFCYAVSKGGSSFGNPVVIPNTGNVQPHGENLPKIIFKPSGEVIALWGTANPNAKNKYSGLVYYVQSFDDGKTWNQPKALVTDTSSYDQRYYDVALLPNGEAGIVWLDNRKTTSKQGSGLYFSSTDGREGFQKGRMISQNCCQCCRTDLFVDSKGGIHALYRGIIKDYIRDMVHIVSTDGGQSFSEPQRISIDNWVINGCPHTGPAMTENKEGIHFAWFTGGKDGGSFYTRSSDNGKTFADRDPVSAAGSHPQLTALPNEQLMIVWEQPEISGNKVFKRIGVQRRNPTGKEDVKAFITPEDGNASYPVVSPMGKNASVVAYVKTDGKKSFITYQVIPSR